MMKVLTRAVIAAAVVGLAIKLAWPDPRLIVTVFDVGQGDAILAQCGTAQMLVDGGPDNLVTARLGEEMPFFDRTIETIVLTHPHADHYFGLNEVLRRYRVENVVLSGGEGGGAEYRAFLETLAANGAQTLTAETGDVIALGDCGRAEVLWPDSTQAVAHDTDDLNTSSVVLRLTHIDAPPDSTAAMLLTGDATEEVEHALLASGANVRADILKVGHHGSRTSSAPEFLDAVRPVYAVISCGTGNKFKHPTPEALQRLEERGTETHRTDLHGNLHYLFTAESATVLRPNYEN